LNCRHFPTFCEGNGKQTQGIWGENPPTPWFPSQAHLVLKSSAASLALSMCTIILAFSALVHRTCGSRHTEWVSPG
jgi:hypothetical protein